MPQAGPPPPPSGTSIETIESVVKAMVQSLEESDRLKGNNFGKSVHQILKNKASFREFRAWLPEDIEVESLKEIKQTDSNDPSVLKAAVLKAAAWDALQVVVLAYLPGSRYFQGAYIYSQLHNPTSLKLIKSTLRVPHRSGTVGWITSHLLVSATSEPYIALTDAQLDLRGRVAVPDFHLGNRAVLGFPVSLDTNNKELASISGFVFFSHPVPGVFQAPDTRLGESFAAARTQYESALASAIESFIFRRSGRSVLAQRQSPRPSFRTPLLTLSDDDPTGYLVSILFEGDHSRNLVADVEINEDVLLETTASLLRVASTYPDKWAPGFVQHMRHLGKLIENKNFHKRLPMCWFSRGDATTQHYPEEWKKEVEASTTELLGGANISAASQTVATSKRAHGIKGALDDVMALFGARTGASRQADLVVPIFCEEANTTHAMGFFRVNCDASHVRDERQVRQVFQSLWPILKEIQNELNPDAAQLFLALETKLSDALGHSCRESPNHAEIRHYKLCTDTVNILSDWLVRQVHRLVLRRISPDAAVVSEAEVEKQRALLGQQERLIRLGLGVLACSDEAHEEARSADLVGKFNCCAAKCNALFERTVVPSGESMPEVTFISFWPRMKLPTLRGIEYVKDEKAQPAEEVFSELLLSDPGLLRMLSLIAPMLLPNETMNLGSDQGLTDRAASWDGVQFGFPTSPDVNIMLVTRPSGVEGVVLDVEWRTSEAYHVRLKWNWDETRGASRELGGHSISNLPQLVAHRLGQNILAELKMTLAEDVDDAGLTDGRLVDYVSSSDQAELERQFGYLERALLYDDWDAAVWRRLRVPTNSHSFAFLAALYNKRIKRPSVLAFRDFALANASSFYVAREYDAQLQAADQYTQNLRAIAHGYKGPIRQLGLAVNQARTQFPGTGAYPATEVSMAFGKIHEMVLRVGERAEDAIRYAVRMRKDLLPERRDWIQVEKEIKGVIQAFNFPWTPIVKLTRTELKSKVEFETVWAYWRHLVANTIDNAIGHGEPNPTIENGFRVFVQPELDSRRFTLKIANFVLPAKLASQANVVESAMKKGKPTFISKSNGKNGDHGFGLLEVHRCCELLGIKPDVKVDEAESKLIVLFDGSALIRGSR